MDRQWSISPFAESRFLIPVFLTLSILAIVVAVGWGLFNLN